MHEPICSMMHPLLRSVALGICTSNSTMGATVFECQFCPDLPILREVVGPALQSLNSSLLVGGGLDKWNEKVGSKMTPPTTWNEIIERAVSRINRNSLENPIGLGAERANCLPCGVSIDGPVVTIAVNGTPIWNGPFAPVLRQSWRSSDAQRVVAKVDSTKGVHYWIVADRCNNSHGLSKIT